MFAIVIKSRKTILAMVLLFSLILYFHYVSLQPVLGLSLHGDDWKVRLWGKTLGQNHIMNIFDNLKKGGYSYLYEIYHIYFLEQMLGFNVRTFHMTNIFIKSLAALSIYPLVLLIFKDRILAFFTTILFTIGYTVSAPLEWVILGGDYWSVLMINLFLITYYLSARGDKINWKWTLLLPVPFLASMFFSPIRAYPLLVVSPCLEIFLLIKKQSVVALKDSLYRLTVVYLPVLFIATFFMSHPLVDLDHLKDTPIIASIRNGNWQKAALSFNGLGLPVIPSSIAGMPLAKFNQNLFKDYHYYILVLPSVIFALTTLLISFILAKRPYLFFLRVFIPNLVINFLFYLPFTRPLAADKLLSASSTPMEIFRIMIGVYILMLAFVTLWEWLFYQRKDLSLITIWAGPFFSILFIICTLTLADSGISFSPIHRYLTIPSLGIYIFMGGILSMGYRKVSSSNNKMVRATGALIILVFFLFYFRTSKDIIADYYNGKLKNGRGLSDNEQMDKQMEVYFKKYHYKPGDAGLFLFDNSEDPQNGQFYEQGFGTYFIYWIHMIDNRLVRGCSAVRNDKKESIKKYLTNNNGQIGFLYPSYCVYNYDLYNYPNYTASEVEVFYPIDSFYAFKLQDRAIIDIREQLLRELNVEEK